MKRRQFLQTAGLAGVEVVLARQGLGSPRGFAPGIQLYAVREPLAADTEGTLKALRTMGYREVESFTPTKNKPAEMRQMVADAGLRLPSAHLGFTMNNDAGPVFAEANALGVQYAVSSFLRQLTDPGRVSLGNGAAKQQALPPMGADGFKRMAARMNELGRGAKAAGLQYAYHNHNFEFEQVAGGGTGFDLLLHETDEALVKFEVDCGWMVAAGGSPVDYFKRYPGRFRMMHVKDFKPSKATIDMVGPDRPEGTELGTGFIKYDAIFAAARAAGLEHAFAEQEAPYVRPQLDSAKVSYEFLRRYES